ncbi:MAG TPA: penicillin acylase family protein [Vicinamibacterales bacterium]|nr:penicillin acylase family protein [Vicinamibacterales bacterium]
MKTPILIVLAACAAGAAAVPRAAVDDEAAGWKRQAANVTIIRDTWGIPHVYGKTDADAVFGVVYAQAEDDFNRVETNFVNAMGRLAEAEGEAEIYRDLRMKLFIDPDAMKADYAKSPAWLKPLMDAWAAGLNYYLSTHPAVTPRVIKRFEPWMALTFSEGSIGGDIERINLADLEKFYGGAGPSRAGAGAAREEPPVFVEPTGSNGIAIAPSNTRSHHSLLLINPHTSFFFRAEAQMASEEGLNAYGAITWGQFFVYQGFNERAGWMHTSSGVDNIDEYLETIVRKNGALYYRYGSVDRPVTVSHITVPYKSADGMARRDFTVYRTHHGPIVREVNGQWVSVRLMQEPLKALMQSYSRTKARSYQAFLDTMQLHTNSSNNTIFADADGAIAYFHSNFIPKRDPRFDWTKPVDGSTSDTEWQEVMSVEETPHLLNPATGWLYNSNNWPWSAAGSASPKRSDYPAYVDRGSEESPRGYHALRVLDNRKDFTVDSLIAAAYDSYLPAFGQQIPVLVKAWDGLAAGDPLKDRAREQIALLRNWDDRWSVDSVPTSIAVYWGEEIGRRVAADARKAGVSTDQYVMHHATPEQLVSALAAASDRLASDFGSWKTPWGQINRYQRLTGDIVQPFDDAAPSIPVGFTSSRWGSLASFGARTYPGTKKMYGTSGNSFVAVVEFGDRVKAKAITAGGESGDPKSPHFGDQALRYSTGDLRPVYFYRDELQGHIERQYHPGEKP